MTLYEIDKQIESCIDMETGEVDVEKLEALQEERDQKIENVALWIKNLRADVAAFKAEEKSLAERRKVAENRILSLTNYLMMACDGKKMDTPKVSVSFRHSQAVEVTDEDKIPMKYLIEQPYKVDKKSIRAALKDGEEIPGATLKETVSAQIK